VLATQNLGGITRKGTRIPRGVADGTYLLFVWKTTGYELREEQGEPPALGAEVEADNGTLRVTKIAPSPLPNDQRQCVYLQGV